MTRNRSALYPLRLTFCAALLVALALTAAPAQDAPAFNGWKQATTNHFRFIYSDTDRRQAAAFARIADEAWNKVSESYSTPPQITDVLITGQTDMVNAFAEGMSYYMGFYTNPPLSPEFGYREDWPTLFFTHELTHIANFAFEGKKHPFADRFGPFWNFINFSALPGWSIEGLTTLMETELTNGGRGRSPFFELLYKAPALENSFIAFDQIGKETAPPKGQIYVMGYLLMRSIADRYGLAAVADIERNRTNGTSFEDSLKLVTGQTSAELFQDVRIALAKKYAGERAIVEGVTISSRIVNTDFYRPALVTDETIITIRDIKDKDRAAVRYDPVKGEEKILFEGQFADELSLTAAVDGTIVAALQSTRMDRMPGLTVSTDLYSWTEAAGLRRLTQHGSLFQPALSRSGNRLVAVELAGVHYRLVEIDIQTGERKILLESENESFIQPALSTDGTQLAFLMLDGRRATLAVAPMPKYEFAYPIPAANITKEVNADGPIIDIAYPSWTADGQLTFASNARGRLEVWEYNNGEKHPVVSDPVGAFWAERIKAGILYCSYASTGYVLKIKPADKWGDVPNFTGPSAPGKIFTLGALASDYPEYTPYPEPAGEDPAKAVVKRGDGERITPVQPVLQNERSFHNVPRLLFWIPTFGYLRLPGNKATAGFGGMAVFAGHPLQNGLQGNSISFGGNLYPSIGQASGFTLVTIPVSTGELSLLTTRNLSHNHDETMFIESSYGLISYGIPIRSRYFYYDRLNLTLITGIEGSAERRNSSVFSASSKLPYRNGATGSLGFDLTWQKLQATDRVASFHLDTNLLVSTFPALSNRLYVSGECNASASSGTKKVRAELGMRTRWFDLPAAAPIPGTLVTPKGETLDCLYPLRSIVQTAIVFNGKVNSRLYAEKLISFGNNSAGMATPDNGTMMNMEIDPWWYTGFEFEGDSGRNRLAFGLVNRFRHLDSISLLRNTSLYMTVKIDALRQTFP